MQCRESDVPSVDAIFERRKIRGEFSRPRAQAARRSGDWVRYHRSTGQVVCFRSAARRRLERGRVYERCVPCPSATLLHRRVSPAHASCVALVNLTRSTRSIDAPSRSSENDSNEESFPSHFPLFPRTGWYARPFLAELDQPSTSSSLNTT